MKKCISNLLGCLLAVVASGGLAQAQEKTFTNSLGMEFVLIPAGQFTNSWTTKDGFEENVHHQHQRVVTISLPFYLGKYPVTQEQWVAVMGEGSNPASFKGWTKPVENVSWNGVQVFIKKLNEKGDGRKYRLPTEAEWEHAARAGSETDWFFGNNKAALREYAWFSDNAQGATHPVGEKRPNPWGLYDIYGNVWEWVQDWFSEYEAGAVTDPVGPTSGTFRVSRGGSWSSFAGLCRSTPRFHNPADRRYDSLGFRLAFSPGQ